MRPVSAHPLPRLAAADVAANKVPPAALRDKTVVVGMTAGRKPLCGPYRGLVFARIRCGGPDLGRIACGPLRDCAELGPHPGMGCSGRHGVVVALPGLRTRVAWGVALGLATLLVAMQWWWLQRALHMVPLWLPPQWCCGGQMLCSVWAALPKRTPGEVPQGSADAERMMALALHGRGELLQAFERFKLLPTSDALKENLTTWQGL